jgi:outer membrane protein assembly complex protein YaeT
MKHVFGAAFEAVLAAAQRPPGNEGSPFWLPRRSLGGLRRNFVTFLLLAGLSLSVGGCKEEGTVIVRSITFKGVTAVEESQLRSALATRQSSRLPWGRKLLFDRSRLDADLQRIVAFYSDRGYPEARVTGVDVKLNDEKDEVQVTLTIAEGDPVLVTGVDFAGFEVIPPGHLDVLRKRIPLKAGRPRDRQEVNASRDLAINELRDHGYPYGKVSVNEVGGARAVALAFTADPGLLAHFGPVEIVGNKTVSDRVIRRQLTIRPGDLYRRSVIQDTQSRLYAMALFQFVNIETLDPERQEPDVRTRVTVAEGKHQRFNLGVGYGTEEKARVDGDYHHVNFLGGARSAGVRARWSSLDRGVRVDFTQPYIFTPHFSFGAEGQQWYTFTPAYQSTVTGGKLTLTHRSSRQTSWSASLVNERDSSAIADALLSDPQLYTKLRTDLIALGLDPTTHRQEGTLNAVDFDLQRSTADNLLNASRGYQLAVHAESAGKLIPGTFSYSAITADGRHYVPVGKRFVVADHLQLGAIDPAGGDQHQVPFAKKYFLGGASSIRGWGRYEVSPLVDGLPIGGNGLLAASSELRAALRGALGGVAFVDAGNVWATARAIDVKDLRYAVGIGLRYRTAIGPVRFDFGYQLNPIDGLIVNGTPQSRRWRIHFSIGQAF